MARKDDTTKPKPHPLAHVPIIDLTKLLPEDLHAVYSALLGITLAVKRLKMEITEEQSRKLGVEPRRWLFAIAERGRGLDVRPAPVCTEQAAETALLPEEETPNPEQFGLRTPTPTETPHLGESPLAAYL